jgi:hypothetical protein
MDAITFYPETEEQLNTLLSFTEKSGIQSVWMKRRKKTQE